MIGISTMFTASEILSAACIGPLIWLRLLIGVLPLRVKKKKINCQR